MGFGSVKTAWLMCHKIRTALIEDKTSLAASLRSMKPSSAVRTRTGIGTAKRLPREHRLSTKTPVIGAVSRKGNVVARVIENVTKEAALSFVREMVSDKVSLLATDESRVYRGLTEYNHQTVDHPASSTSSVPFIPTRLRASGRSSSAASSALSTRSAPNICPCMSRSFSSGIITETTRIFSKRRLRGADAI